MRRDQQIIGLSRTEFVYDDQLSNENDYELVLNLIYIACKTNKMIQCRGNTLVLCQHGRAEGVVIPEALVISCYNRVQRHTD